MYNVRGRESRITGLCSSNTLASGLGFRVEKGGRCGPNAFDSNQCVVCQTVIQKSDRLMDSSAEPSICFEMM